MQWRTASNRLCVEWGREWQSHGSKRLHASRALPTQPKQNQAASADGGALPLVKKDVMAFVAACGWHFLVRASNEAAPLLHQQERRSASLRSASLRRSIG